MFALVSGDDIYLKSDSDSLHRFMTAGSRPFSFEKQGKRTETSYWSLPDPALDDGDLLKSWADLAYEAALRARAASKRVRKA